MATNTHISRLGSLVGTSTAALHFSAALKSLPFLNKNTLDITMLLFLTSTIASFLRLFFQKLELSKKVIWYFLLQFVFGFWFVLSGCWTQSQNIALQKLIEIVLVPPLFTFLGLSVVSDHCSFESFKRSSLLIAIVVSITIPPLLFQRLATLGGPTNTDLIRVQYQVVGLNLASACCVIACKFVVEGKKVLASSVFLLSLFSFTLLLLGARAAFFSLIFSIGLSSFAICYLMQKERNFVFFIFVLFFPLSLAILLLVVINHSVFRAFTLLRISTTLVEGKNVRVQLWRSAIAQADFIGLGVAGFAPTAGFGDLRRWYTHNLWLESFAEGGFLGMLIFSGVLGYALMAFLTSRRKLSPLNFGIILGLLIIGLSQMLTSSDLGNRMIWLWLGLSFAGSVYLRQEGKL